MTRSIFRAASVIALALTAQGAGAQQAMTVTGHVTSRNAPLKGARVRLAQLGLERVTDVDGRYSFLIPSGTVRGQAVTLSATMDDRHTLYRPASVEIALAGGEVVRDFALLVDSPAAELAGARDSAGMLVLDALDIGALSGSATLAQALAGRVVGLEVVPAAVPGGTDHLQYRGTRSVKGANEPLVVIDGLVADNTSFSSAAERHGSGGFDYGSPLQDLRMSNLSSVRWLSPAEATARYGSRAANGVLMVGTNNGGGILGLTISANQLVAAEAPLLLPAFQNAYGQGLDGTFEFFDGRGGGIHDNVDQSWGPALDGRPLQQASLTDAGRADVRIWRPMPDNVRDYFNSARTSLTSASIQRGAARSAFRAFVDDRESRGLAPEHQLTQRDGGLSLTLRPSSRVSASANGTFARTTNTNAPGTGYDESNPVAQFVRIGRQVDIAALRSHLRDSIGRQISWNYVGHNNPYFAALGNSNQSVRDRATGVVTLTVLPAPWLALSTTGGIDGYRDARRLTIGSGWMGGFPAINGRGDFSRGGLQHDDIFQRRVTGAASLAATRAVSDSVRWTTTVGVDYESHHQSVLSVGVDSGTILPPSAPSISWDDQSTRQAAFGNVAFVFGDASRIVGGVRAEQWSMGGAPSSTTLYPGAQATVDLARIMPAFQNSRTVNNAIVHAAWSRTASEFTPFALQAGFGGGNVYSGGIAPAGSPVSNVPGPAPEMTTTAEAGLALTLAARHLTLGATGYSATTDAVLFPLLVGNIATAGARSGSVSNRGVEVQGSVRAGDAKADGAWTLAVSAAHNTNRVETLSGDGAPAPLFPGYAGVGLQARVGSSLNELVGLPYLRSSTGALLLRNGLPLPDSVAGAKPLGETQPAWLLGLRNTIRYRRVTLDVMADAHVGGSFYSATRMSGSYAGTLQETAFRPDSGLLVDGVDAVTDKPNTVHVTTQDYYHALAAVPEAWVYSATYGKIREARLSMLLPTTLTSLPFESATIAIVGRNLFVWSRVAGIDPEAALANAAHHGIEWGQVPYARSIGLQVTVTP